VKRQAIQRRLFQAVRVLAATCPLMLFGQTGDLQSRTWSTTDFPIPASMAAGTPAGSYLLSGIDSVNIYSGKVNVAVPLMKVGGRGEAGYTMYAKVTPPGGWRVETNVSFSGSCGLPWPEETGCYYRTDRPVDDWWNSVEATYGPGFIVGRRSGTELGACPGQGEIPFYHRTLTHFVFTGPDGTEHMLFDQGGIGLTPTYNCTLPGPQQRDVNRGKVFVSKDGSGLTFIADQDIYDWSDPATYSNGNDTFRVAGTLWQNDGTRYTVDTVGRITLIRDRNGNKVSFTYRQIPGMDSYQVSKVVDPLNREINIYYSEACGGSYGTCDRITFSGTGGATRTIRISKAMLKDTLRADEAARYQSERAWNLFGALPLAQNVNADDAPVTSAIWLPDDRNYRFYFNRYLEVAKIQLPTGGGIEYDYGPGVRNGHASGQVGNAHSSGPEISPELQYRIHMYRRVTERRVLPDGLTRESVTRYGRPETLPSNWETYQSADTSFVSSDGPFVEELYAGDGTTKLRSVKHYYYALPGEPSTPAAGGSPAYYLSSDRILLHHSPYEGKEYLTEHYDKTASTVLKKEDRTWRLSGEPRVVNMTGVTSSVQQNSGSMVASTTSFAYDQYNNETNRVESDFGGAALRTTSTTYYTDPVNDAAYLAAYLRRLVKKVSVWGSTEESRTEYFYDDAGTSEAASGAPNLEAVGGVRGNVVGVRRWLNDGTSPEVTRAYYDTGSLYQETDARNATTTLTYGCGGGALATVTNALNHTVTITPDCSTLKPSSVQDPNGVVTSYGYADNLDRVTSVSRGSYDKVAYEYLDGQKKIVTNRDKGTQGDGELKSELVYDGLGRTVKTKQYESTNAAVTVETEYNALGGVARVSNPYRGAMAEAWTTTQYDDLGRVQRVTTDDGAVTLTEYDGATVTMTDPAGVKRKTTHDGLGRIVSVVEAPGSLNYGTIYSYSALDHLRQVTQGTQLRTFTYDTLGQLVTAVNPESGTTCYGQWVGGVCQGGYDGNGNLVKKTDARGVVTTIGYDSLNRILTKSYSDGTPGVGYLYDTDVAITGVPTENRSIGRLVQVTGGTGSTVYRWDGVGRALASRQEVDGTGYVFEYGHKPAGPGTMKYPSGRVVTWDYDDAGRVNLVSGQKDSVATSYASSIGYAAHGALASMTLGNTLTEAWDYSPKRLQARRVRVGTTGEWQFSYCAGSYTAECAQNNGNVLSELILPLNATQTFTYDAVNRLKTFVDSGGPRQTYVYDRFGNRALIGGTANGNYVPAAPPTPQVTNDDAAQAAAIFAGNRWVGSTADAAGNLTQPATGAYPGLTFDAENRVKSAVTGSTASETYSYDGEGRRVKKVSGNVATVYVYSADGKLAAEYATAPPAESGTRYLTVDHLGSTRLVTGASGVVDKRYDYLPFGQELVAGVGGRTSALRYLDGAATDGQRVRFTGQVRDVESGLDYFLARYYGGAQGRFTSPDAPLLDQHPQDPQSWNLYSYARNNPLKYVDASGNAIELNGNADEREKLLQALQEAVGKKAGAYLYPNPEKDEDGKLTGRYFVGVLSGGPSGKGQDFAEINGASNLLSGVIADSQIAQVRMVDAGENFTYFRPTNRQTTLDSSTVGLTSPFNEPGPIKVWVLNPVYGYGDLPGFAMSNGAAGSRAIPDTLMHELGHAAWQMDVKVGRRVSPDPYGNNRALDFENAVRRRHGGATREVH